MKLRKKVWLFNHYATYMIEEKLGRQYWFAENLNKSGYDATVFCANTFHGTDKFIELNKSKYKVEWSDSIPFVIVKTIPYLGNGIKRVLNMFVFYWNLLNVAQSYSIEEGKPDVIVASSVHPLTLLAGIRIAKKMDIPCICEVRDLWPESIFEFAGYSKKTLLAKFMYLGEKWIYKKADKLIFTMEGGKDYIIDQKWDQNSGGPVDTRKVHHINNGIDLEVFDRNIVEHEFNDVDLDEESVFKIVYAGSIRKANNVELIVNAAKYIQDRSKLNVKFLIFGDGNERIHLEKKCQDEDIKNVVFKGKVERKFIPSILSKSNLNILNYTNHGIWKYGGSQNKNFEYLASGRPVLSTIKMGYDIIEKYGAGISIDNQTTENIAESIIQVADMSTDEYQDLCNRSRRASEDYDFGKLTKKLIDIIETL